jgi:hypothetical protein
MGKKSDCVAINRDDSDDDSDDDVEIMPNKHKKSSKISIEFGHTAKLGILTFILFLLIMSDVFIERVLGKTTLGLVTGRTPTKKGICAQGVILVLAMTIIHILITNEKI